MADRNLSRLDSTRPIGIARTQRKILNAEKLTTKSREVIQAAIASATQRGHATVEPWHLLLALLDTGGSTAAALLRAVRARLQRQRAQPRPRVGERAQRRRADRPPAGRRVHLDRAPAGRAGQGRR